MRRLVLIPVLFSLLLNGLLWAAGGHLEAFGAGGVGHAAEQPAGPGDGGHDTAGSGHCCHSPAHLLALPARRHVAGDTRPAIELPPYRCRATLHAEPPLLQPPIA